MSCGSDLKLVFRGRPKRCDGRVVRVHRRKGFFLLTVLRTQIGRCIVHGTVHGVRYPIVCFLRKQAFPQPGRPASGVWHG